eukprot:TRINITY_DN530_c0_g1_i2.p1 TRINITY_DN530_c0_g1~~TRINITY_DN530_c0_g1_i2.p1  ORF type:complete len:132 (-),score=14.56 TRINITY_DN530_c0_g1_i2:111-506(-)
MNAEDLKLKEIKNLVQTLPKQTNLFRSFIFDDNFVWVGVYTKMLKKVLFFAKREFQVTQEEDTFWSFINTQTRLDSKCVAKTHLHQSGSSITEIYFPLEFLERFVNLIKKLADSSPELSKKKMSHYSVVKY